MKSHVWIHVVDSPTKIEKITNLMGANRAAWNEYTNHHVGFLRKTFSGHCDDEMATDDDLQLLLSVSQLRSHNFILRVIYFGVCPGRSWQTNAMYESLGCFLGPGGTKGISTAQKKHLMGYHYSICVYLDVYLAIFSVLCVHSHFVTFFCSTVSWWSQGPPSTAPTHWPQPQNLRWPFVKTRSIL